LCDIRRINKLKLQSQKLITRVRDYNPVGFFQKSYVSRTGLTCTDLSEKIDKISQCASILELRENFEQTPSGLEQVLSVAAANFCKNPTVCCVCADRMQARRRARFNDSIKHQARQVMDGNRYGYFFTYTIKDSENLGDAIDHLKTAKRSFRRMGQKRGSKRSGGEAAKITAAISTIEIKRGKNSGLWHAHSHDLVFTDQKIDYQVYDQSKKNELKSKYGKNIPREKLREIAIYQANLNSIEVAASKLSMEWLQATGGQSIGIDVVPLKHVPDSAKGAKKRKFERMSFEDSIAYQAREILKYPAKIPYNQPADVLTLIQDTYNKRMTATYGEFRGIPGDEYNDDEAKERGSFVMRWDPEQNRYADPQPGKMRDIEEEEAHATRVTVGQLLGQYRRQRKSLISIRDRLGNSLFQALDNAKWNFRSKINAHWSLYRQRVSYSKRTISEGCDKYSPVLALTGMWIPNSTSRDIYSAAFS